MSGGGSDTMSQHTVTSKFYHLVSDVKEEICKSDDEREITASGLQEEPELHERDSNSVKKLKKFNRNTFQNETPSVDYEIDIKYETLKLMRLTSLPASVPMKVTDIQLNPTQDTVDDLDIDRIRPIPLKRKSINSEEKELNGFYSDLLLCERDCLVCQDYIRKLSEHVRAIHAVRQPALDPLHIDSLDANKSTAIEINPVIDGDIERMDSEENDSNFESEVESRSDREPDYNTTRKPKSGQKLQKKKGSQKNEMVCQPKIHNGEKPFKCEICGVGFTQNNVLTVHLRRHTAEKSFKCKECGKGFARKDNLAVHMMIHTGERPYKCANCAKCFKTKTILNDHMCHTGERPFECEQCGKGFTTSRHFGIHKKSHDKGRPYKCDMCEKDFKRRDTLNRHKRKNCRNNI